MICVFGEPEKEVVIPRISRNKAMLDDMPVKVHFSRLALSGEKL